MTPDFFKQKAWIQEAADVQKQRAQLVLDNCCLYLDIQKAEVVEVKDNDRFVLHYEQDPNRKDFAKNMIKLETLMRQTMGVVVDLRLETKQDRNNRAKRNGRE